MTYIGGKDQNGLFSNPKNKVVTAKGIELISPVVVISFEAAAS